MANPPPVQSAQRQEHQTRRTHQHQGPRLPMSLLKVEDVDCWRGGRNVYGTLHVTADHLIFSYNLPLADAQQASRARPQSKTNWIAYPMIAHCKYRPAPTTHTRSVLRIRCRDFTFVAFYFNIEIEGRNTYDMLKNLTCKRGQLEKLYAFSYIPPPPEVNLKGWDLYDPRKELARLGISANSADKGWRITEINRDYSVSESMGF